MDRQICTERGQTDRLTQARTDKKVKTKGPMILSNDGSSIEIICNCRDKSDCPILGKCCSSSVVYKASVTNVSYIGMTEWELKTRYRNHIQSFKDENKKVLQRSPSTYGT